MKFLRSLCFFVLLAFFACGGKGLGPLVPEISSYEVEPVAPGAPTVILISIDTLRADRLGCYGAQQPTSPQIDLFREQAVLFDQAIAQAPSTLPSHASIFTSMIPEHHGAFFSRRLPLSPSVPTLAAILADAGYRTAAFTGGGQIAPEFGLDRGFEIYGVNLGGPGFDAAVASGLEWLGQKRVQPAFLFLHTYEVHHPYTPRPDLLDLFDDGYTGDLPDEISKKLLKAINFGEVPFDKRDLEHVIAAYDAEIRSVDEAFGDLLAGLEELGLTENSLIIFTSDHGEEFGEHGAVGWHSHTLYDELLRVPLLIRYPEGRHAGLSVTDQVRLLDVAPTILGAAGLTAPRGFEGIDLELVINGLPTPLPAVSQMDWPEGDPPLSVRSLNWKLYPKVVVAGARFSREEPSFVTRVVNRIGRWRNANVLFDLVDDPGELNNVLYDNFWTSEGMRKIGERVRAERPVPEPVHKVTVDDSTEERLRALGYLD